MPAGYGIVKHAKDLARLNRKNAKNRGNFQRTYKNKFPDYDFNFNELSPEELEEFRIQYLKKSKRENIRTVLLTIAITLILGATIWWIISSV